MKESSVTITQDNLGSTMYSLRAPTVRYSSNSSCRLRIVCISDTHGKHSRLNGKIPDGDILIHAGDFTNKLRKSNVKKSLKDFNTFMGSLPHKHKIVIAGNHEIAFNEMSKTEIQDQLSNCVYLQDSEVIVEGLKVYGSPWTNSVGMGFSCRGKHLYQHWAKIPENTDILVTHIPPEGLLDLAFDFEADRRGPCPDCHRPHRKYAHWGSESLTQMVRRIRPRVHVFGHVHDSHGYLKKNGTLYVNAAQDQTEQPIFFDWESTSPRLVPAPVQSRSLSLPCSREAGTFMYRYLSGKSMRTTKIDPPHFSPILISKKHRIQQTKHKHGSSSKSNRFTDHSPLHREEEDTQKSCHWNNDNSGKVRKLDVMNRDHQHWSVLTAKKAKPNHVPWDCQTLVRDDISLMNSLNSFGSHRARRFSVAGI